MAKISFAKLGLKLNEEVKKINYDIEVKQYLPVKEKLRIIKQAIEQATAADSNSFQNPVKLEVFGSLEIAYAYTNLSFTDKQKEEPDKLYDLLDSSGLLNEIVSAIPTSEYNFIISGIEDTAKSIYEYKTSALGILDAISEDYSNLSLNVEELSGKITNPENLKVLKETLDKMG